MDPNLPPLGHSFTELQTVDSTNNYATARVHAGMAQHGDAVFAHAQTAGRGQRGNQWTTGEQNIALSIVVQPYSLPLSQMFYLSMATAMGVQRFFNNYTAGDTSIKWPNDIYWRDRKAGGILIENVLQGAQWNYAVIGIGININQLNFDFQGKQAVSLRQITGREYNAVALAKELCGYLQNSLAALVSEKNQITQEYHQVLYKKNEVVKLRKGSRVFETCVKRVSENGELITEHAVEERFAVGEVEWLI